jgi:cytochrome c553
MRTFSSTFSLTTATVVLGAALLSIAHTPAAAKAPTPAKPAASSVSQGKALVTKFRCDGCHNADLKGKPGFSPSIRKTGSLHDYTQAQFVTLMNTGMKNDGSSVHPPMPVFAKMSKDDAVSIFQYLETLK